VIDENIECVSKGLHGYVARTHDVSVLDVSQDAPLEASVDVMGHATNSCLQIGDVQEIRATFVELDVIDIVKQSLSLLEEAAQGTRNGTV
jgi:hypothetical protein